MTPQEQDMIGGLIDRVQKTRLTEKDADAEQMLQQGLGPNPDAIYILAQTLLVQKYALEQAQTQLSEAKTQIEQMRNQAGPIHETRHATSFLGSLLGRSEPPAPPPPRPYSTQQEYPSYAPGQGGAVPQYSVPTGMGGGGFLQGALQTAAGVAAGALAFQGVESLMHGFGHAAGYGQDFTGMGGGQGDRPGEVINNYYGGEKTDAGNQRDTEEHGISADERSLGAQEDRDFGNGNSSDSSTGDRDPLYANDDSTSTNDSSFDTNAGSADDSSFGDSGSDFGGDDAGGGDDSSFS